MTTPDPDPGPCLDADLVAALRAGGDRAGSAWSSLVHRHSAKMYAVARAFGVGRATAEDLVQTAWLRLLERPDQLRDPGAVGPWLCMVVRNEARRYVTRHREVPAALDLGVRAATGGEPVDAGLLRDEQGHALRLAFARMTEDCQRLLRLLTAEPALSYDEIAAVVGRPRGSLGPTRRRCLDQLRRLLPAGFER